MISDSSIDKRVRYAINILTYATIKNGLHYAEPWAHLFLSEMKRKHGESAEVSLALYPVICKHCGKIVGSNKRYATIYRPRFAGDCCYKIEQSPVAKRIYEFTVFDLMPVVHVIADYMDVPQHYVQHLATLEAMKYFARKEQKLNELSRYYVKPSISDGFDTISSLT